MIEIEVEPHPALRLRAFETRFPTALGARPAPDSLTGLLRLGVDTPFTPDENLRTAIRDMLRHGGYKPTGRGKPASEYLLRAVQDRALDSINLAVDACNAASLHGGIPISVIDLDRAQPPFHIGIAPAGTRYVFNAAGQEIDVAGLLCLSDAAGPCANAVKDAQRTKTTPDTIRTLSVLWGAAGHEPRLDAVADWYRSLLEGAGARTVTVR